MAEILLPWPESMQAMKDGAEEAEHVLTVFAMAWLEQLTLASRDVHAELMPFEMAALQALEYHSLVTIAPTEAPQWHRVRITAVGEEALSASRWQYESDLANREGVAR